MEPQNTVETWAAVKKYCESHLDIEAQCEFGQLYIIHPPNVTPDGLNLYVLGFNGTGEKYIKNGKNELGSRYINVCKNAATAVGVSYFIMAERCPWGSPTISKFKATVGSKVIIREVLKLNAQANRALFREHPPLLVWGLGVSRYIDEAIEDYDLTEIDYSKSKKGTLWRHFKNTNGVPFLFSKHPTGARPTVAESVCVYAKLAELARGRRA